MQVSIRGILVVRRVCTSWVEVHRVRDRQEGCWELGAEDASGEFGICGVSDLGQIERELWRIERDLENAYSDQSISVPFNPFPSSSG